MNKRSRSRDSNITKALHQLGYARAVLQALSTKGLTPIDEMNASGVALLELMGVIEVVECGQLMDAQCDTTVAVVTSK